MFQTRNSWFTIYLFSGGVTPKIQLSGNSGGSAGGNVMINASNVAATIKTEDDPTGSLKRKRDEDDYDI